MPSPDVTALAGAVRFSPAASRAFAAGGAARGLLLGTGTKEEPLMRALTLRSTRFFCALALAAASALPACDPPLDHETDSQLVAARAAEVYESAARAAEALDESGQPMVRKLTPELDRLLGDLLPQDRFTPAAREPRPAASGLQALRQLMVQTGDDIDQSAAEVQRAIAERLLARANIESEAPEAIVYRLRREVTCADPDNGALEPACADFLGKVELRLRLTRAGQGHEIELLVGPARLQPLAALVRGREVSLTAKLAAVKPSTDHISERVGEPPPPLPAMMKGTVQLTIAAEGTRKASVSLGLLDLVDIRDPDQGLVIRTQAADPRVSVVRLGVDGDARRLQPSANLGQTEVIFPLEDRSVRPNAPDARVVVAGVHGLGAVDLDRQEITFQSVSLGLGPSYAEVRGQRIFQLDLNRDHGRALDLEIAVADGRPRLSISPRLDLTVMWKLMLIESDLSERAPEHLRDETYRLLVDAPPGEKPTLTQVTAADGRDAEDTKVVSGRLQLSSNKVPRPVAAEAGQCLSSRAPSPGEHPVLGTVSVYACP
jgi:hypothetical protein